MASYWQSAVLWLATSSRLYDSTEEVEYKKDVSPTSSSEKRSASAKGLTKSPRASSSSRPRDYTSAHNSFAPIILLPGVVNTSIILLPPPFPGTNATLRRRSRFKLDEEKESKDMFVADADSDVSRSRRSSLDSQSSCTPDEYCTLSRRSPYSSDNVQESLPAISGF